ncbi:MAG: hypothetical protein ACOX9R_01685 [Armatimonadota bacterium]
MDFSKPVERALWQRKIGECGRQPFGGRCGRVIGDAWYQGGLGQRRCRAQQCGGEEHEGGLSGAHQRSGLPNRNAPPVPAAARDFRRR